MKQKNTGESMHKKEILNRLEKFAILLELNDANTFRIRAYQNGIRALETTAESLDELIAEGNLSKIKGIGKGLSAHIETLYHDKEDTDYEELNEKTPTGLLDMLGIPGLGPKKVKKIYKELGIASLGELEYACNENRLVTMKGFGAKTQANILKGLEFLKQKQGRFLYPFARDKAEPLLTALSQDERIVRVSVAGSLRRCKEDVKDIDFVASCAEADRDAIMADFVALEQVESIVGQGNTKSSVRLKSGIGVDLRLVNDEAFPHLLQHMTGSKEHNTELRALAKSQGLKVNEYGLFEGDTPIYCKDESEIYARLGLQYIAPELRENQGEIALAQAKALPELVKAPDIQGVFHAHTTWSDGANTLAEMVDACQALGYHYLGVTEHSASAVYAHGLQKERVIAQWEEIQQLNDTLENFKVLRGIEVDILGDGSLDYDDDLLAGFDFVIASVHSQFKMSEADMTARILKAVEHPSVTMIGHLTGRILLAREGYPVNVPRIIDACVEHKTLIELNAHPSRLDLDWRYGNYAREKGLMISINPDAHSVEGLQDVQYGIGIARKAGFAPEQVLNTRSLAEVEAVLAS